MNRRVGWTTSDPWVSCWSRPLRENAAGAGYECLPACETVAVKDQSSYVQWQPNNQHLVHLHWEDRLPIFLSPALEPARWHQLDEPGLGLSPSANVWVCWCAVTGPDHSTPHVLRASCCCSSVCVSYSHKQAASRGSSEKKVLSTVIQCPPPDQQSCLPVSG